MDRKPLIELNFVNVELVCELVFFINLMEKKAIKTKFSFVYKTILNS